MEVPIWRSRLKRMLLVLLHGHALEHPGEEESCHSPLPFPCSTQVACPSQRAAGPPENFTTWELKRKDITTTRGLLQRHSLLNLNSFNRSLALSPAWAKPGFGEVHKGTVPALCAHGIVAHNLIARGNPAHAWPALIRRTIRQLFSPRREHAGFPVAARGLALSPAGWMGSGTGWDQHLVACHCESF